MPTQLLLHLSPDNDNRLRWVRYDTKQGAAPAASGVLADVAGQAQGAHVVGLVPTTQLLLARLSFPTGNRQKILKAVPFALEDQLATDIEDLHVAVGSRGGDGYVGAVAVARAQMDSLQAQLRNAGLTVDYLVPDIVALPQDAQVWQLYVDARVALLRTPTHAGFAFDASNCEFVLQLLRDEIEDETPVSLKIWNATGGDLDFAPSLARYAVEIETVNDLLGLAARTGVDTKQAINLLQGDYSRREQLGKYLRPWRLAASLVGVWFLVQVISAIIDGNELQAENDALKAQVVKTFQQAAPEVKKVVNAKVQMERKLAELKGGGGDSSVNFLSLLGDSAQAFKDTNGLVLRSIRYKPRELDIELEVPTIQDLDQLKQRLSTQAKLNVEIQSASSKDNKVQGRINIKST